MYCSVGKLQDTTGISDRLPREPTNSSTGKNCRATSGEWFRHDNVVPRHFCWQRRRKRGGADFDIPEAAIKRWQRGTLTDDPQVDRAAATGAEIVFCGGHQPAPQTCALASRIHCEQPQVAAAFENRQINASHKSG